MLYDFYYSAENEYHMKKMCNIRGEKYKHTLVNGMKYTEMIESGKEPLTKHFGDIKLVCTTDTYNIDVI